ncbi:MAG: hypothetical protein BIFFINMI_00088 [Phycisphaerae bacterium]|nr:hypothetical protein [Phycisphaerae bacterium]
MYLKLILVALLPLICLIVGCQQPRSYDFHSITLDNGLQVLTLEDFSSPIVAVQVWYQVGSVNERPDRQGFAHMFEHMMFRRTERLGPKAHFEYVRRTGGDCNAYTSFDRTVYHERLPANQLPLALWLESERMAFLRVTPKDYNTERKVVEEERRLGLNRPYGTVFEKVIPAVFPKHPYRWTPIGNIPDLRAADIDDVRSFWRRYYLPNNARLVIVGAVRTADAQRLAREYFNWIPAGPTPPKVDTPDEPLDGPHLLTIDEPTGPLPRVTLAYRTVPATSGDDIALDFMAQVLGGGESSRLYLDLVKARRIASDANAYSYTLQYGGLFGISATLLRPDADTAAALADLHRQIDRIRDEPISEEEWTKARNQLLRDEVTSRLTADSRASRLGYYATTFGDAEEINRRLGSIRAVTREDVQRVARRYFVPGLLTEVTVKPVHGKAPDSDQDAPEPTTRPDEEMTPSSRELLAEKQRPADLGSAPPIAPLLAEIPPARTAQRTLANGLQIVVVPDRQAPFVRMKLACTFGSFCETSPGAAMLAMEMITRGSAHHTAAALAEELDRYAITLSGSVDDDAASVDATCLSEHTQRTANLLAEVVTSPAFDAHEFDILRDQEVSQLTVKFRGPGYVADRVLREQLFPGHPYRYSPAGWPDKLAKLTPHDVAAWWSASVRPDTCVLYVAGDVTPDAAFALADATLGQWKAAGPPPAVDVPPAPPTPATRIVLVDRPGLVQSEIRIGQVGPTRRDADYADARLMSQYFGGGFNSRLMQSLRIDKGLTYGVGGGFYPMRFAGQFRVSTFTRTETTAQAVQAALEQIDDIRTAAPAAEELDIARSYIVGSFAGSRETPGDVVRDLWMIRREGLPDDFLERYLATVKASSAAELLRVARTHIDPKRLVIVVVADAAKVKDSLEKIAPVTLLKE